MSDALSAPEFKYTDRQVREDVDLRVWAEAYTSAYGGSFEPLLSARRELRATGRLETRTARVVLNCARYDQNFQDQMPDPKPPVLELVKTEFRKKSLPFCSDPRPHDPHTSWRVGKPQNCRGVPFEINRVKFQTWIEIKAEFATARTGAVIHRATGIAWQWWNPPAHTMGPAERGDLIVKTVCMYPSKLCNPILFLEEPIDLPNPQKKGPEFKVRCPNGCFK